MRQHGHVICDNLGCGAITPESSSEPFARHWESVEWEGGEIIDLCPGCAERRQDGHLHAIAVCSRCGRSNEDGLRNFRRVPPDETAHRLWHIAPSDRMTVCIDCFDRERDQFRC